MKSLGLETKCRSWSWKKSHLHQWQKLVSPKSFTKSWSTMVVSGVRMNLFPHTWTTNKEGMLPKLGPCPHESSCVSCTGKELHSGIEILLCWIWPGAEILDNSIEKEIKNVWALTIIHCKYINSPLPAADWSNCSRLTSTQDSNVSTALTGCRICWKSSASFWTNSPLQQNTNDNNCN